MWAHPNKLYGISAGRPVMMMAAGSSAFLSAKRAKRMGPRDQGGTAKIPADTDVNPNGRRTTGPKPDWTAHWTAAH
jgi:hypothetical protein